MVAISVTIEAQEGLTWPGWRRLVGEVERLGFAGLYRSDHFRTLHPPHRGALELVASLAYLADHTRRVRFGPLVAPLSFRDPVHLAHQAAALDDLSGGRMVLGVGAGWVASEHEMFGYALGDTATRLDRLGEGLAVMTRLLRSDEPVSLQGRFYRLHEAVLLPRPQRAGGPPILLGGNGPRRTLPLVAQYADIWNGLWLTPEDFRDRSARLDGLLRAAGRQPGEVERTMTVLVYCGRDVADLERRVGYMRRFLGVPDLPLDDLVERLRTRFQAIVGPPERVAEHIEAYAGAGVEELMLQWTDVEDVEGLQILAEEVLPLLERTPRQAHSHGTGRRD